MTRWYVCRNGQWVIEARSNKPKCESYLVEWEYTWVEVYELIEDEDGTKSLLLSERKLANRIDKERMKEFKDKNGIYE